MDDLAEFEQRAEALRHRLAAYIADIGEYASSFRQLHAELAEIDEHLKALRGVDVSE
jgi:uncharacterized coiled-coil DUF342 family protein